MKNTLLAVSCLAAVGTTVFAQNTAPKPAQSAPTDWKKVTDAEWKRLLKPGPYQVLRHARTEPPFNNDFWNNHKAGTYVCAGCGNILFSSATKFESGTGWPSFWKPQAKTSVTEKKDPDGSRVEVLCQRCDGHLGHVFNDATGEYGIQKTETGLRYCMNSAAMKFIPTPKK